MSSAKIPIEGGCQFVMGGGGVKASPAPPSKSLHVIHKLYRLSHDYLTGEVSQLSAKVKQLEKKCKKCPDDLKAQLKTFLGVR